MIASVVLAFGEFVWENRLLAFTPGRSLCAEMCKELKFSVDPRLDGDSKPVPKEGGAGGSDDDDDSEAKSLLPRSLLGAEEDRDGGVSHHTYGVISDVGRPPQLTPHDVTMGPIKV